MRFIADHMLGSLARWLRFMGYDTVYPGPMNDRDIVHLAKEEGRVLLTRDRELSKARSVESLYIESTDLENQLDQVLSKFMMTGKISLSRCSLCNSVLELVEKEGVKEFVPERVFELRDSFWYCRKCHKYYWAGTHFEKIMEKIRKLDGKTAPTQA
jgi:uncharacterized protein with PIN domain